MKPKPPQLVNSGRSWDSPPIQVKVRVEECVISMEVDKGAALSIMSETTYKNLLKSPYQY